MFAAPIVSVCHREAYLRLADRGDPDIGQRLLETQEVNLRQMLSDGFSVARVGEDLQHLLI